MAGEVSDYKSIDIYKFYCSRVDKGIRVEYSVFMSIMESFNKKLVEDILNNASNIRLPYNMGEIRVRKKEMNLGSKKSLNPDWKATKELWDKNPKLKEKKQLVYHLNEHRKGFRYKILWNKRLCKIKYQNVFYFKPTRAFSRGLAKILKTNFEIDYYL